MKDVENRLKRFIEKNCNVLTSEALHHVLYYVSKEINKRAQPICKPVKEIVA